MKWELNDMEKGVRQYSCFIVDDDDIDRRMTLSLVKKYSFLKLEGIFENAEDALKSALSQPPDVLFLDIDMPEMNGLDLRRELEKISSCIFITAYPEYALQSFEVNALDFMVKPLDEERFDRSMDRLEHFLDVHYKAELVEHSLNEDSIFIKDGHDHVKIQLSDIIYLEALRDYTGIITKDRKYSVLSPLGNLLKENLFQAFIRIHRSYAVHKHFIRKVTPKSVEVNHIILPVGRNYKESLEFMLTP